MADDLESFIRQQKAKLLEERQLLEPVTSPRNSKQTDVNGTLKQSAVMPPRHDDANVPNADVAVTRPATPQLGLIGKLGQYEQRRKKLMEERNNEYNRMIAKKAGASNDGIDVPNRLQPSSILPHKSLRSPSGEGVNPDLVNMPGMRVRQSAEVRQQRLKEERQREYNTMLAQKKKKGEGHSGDTSQPDGNESMNGVMAGLRNHPSAEQMKAEMRNQEYNNFLRQKYGKSDARNAAGRAVRISLSDSDDEPLHQHRRGNKGVPAPRRGWATPTYEETLQQKRQEERRYRKYDDPELYKGTMRASLSDGNLNSNIEADNRYCDDDSPYDNRRVHFERDRPTRREPSQDLELEFAQWLRELKHKYDSPGADPVHNDASVAKPAEQLATKNRADSKENAGPQKAASNDIYGTSLLLPGHGLSETEAQRHKQEYSDELQRQIEQTRKTRSRNFNSNQTSETPIGVPTNHREEAPIRRPDPDNYSYRQPPQRIARDGILNRGWNNAYAPSALQRPRVAESAYPPKPLGYGEAPGLGAFKSSLDEAYHYYGMTNLLDPNPSAPHIPADNYLTPRHQTAVPITGTMDRSDGPSQSRHVQPSRSGTTSMLDVSLDRNASNQKEKKATYQAELLRQIEEQKEVKRRRKEEQERFDQRLEDECRAYDPFGKGGGGAAMRDREGNLITNLRDMHLDNEQKWRTPEKTHPGATNNAGMAPAPDTSRSSGFVASQPNPSYAVTSPRQDSLPPGDGEKTFARGGHGIFGDPMSDVQKTQQQRYQDDLRKQIAEKKRHQEQERQQQRVEDEKLMQRIADENHKMERELEEERRKERDKQEKAQQLRDEQKKQEEEKRRKMEAARREDDERKQLEARRMLDEEAKTRQAKQHAEEQEQRLRAAKSASQEKRPPSPPVPAIKHKNESETTTPLPPKAPSRQARSNSPPVRAVSRESRPPSSNVLSQLARMRQQLQSERRRVEHDLKKTREEPDVYDPRLSEKPATMPQRAGNVDVFEVARNREPVSVRRPQVETNEENLEEFNQLKNKANSGSRTALRSMYPESPTNGSTLEEQQRALLKQQEQSLRRMKKSPYDSPSPHPNPKRGTTPARGSTASSTAMLESESAFIAMENGGDKNFGSRATLTSAASRQTHNRRAVTPKSPTSARSYMTGSAMSLNPEKISSKNEERMRKLKLATDKPNEKDKQIEKDDPVNRVGRMQQRIDVLEEVCSRLAAEVAKAVDIQTRRLLSETSEISQ